jgi:hypothetical protein
MYRLRGPWTRRNKAMHKILGALPRKNKVTDRLPGLSTHRSGAINSRLRASIPRDKALVHHLGALSCENRVLARQGPVQVVSTTQRLLALSLQDQFPHKGFRIPRRQGELPYRQMRSLKASLKVGMASPKASPALIRISKAKKPVMVVVVASAVVVTAIRLDLSMARPNKALIRTPNVRRAAVAVVALAAATVKKAAGLLQDPRTIDWESRRRRERRGRRRNARRARR